MKNESRNISWPYLLSHLFSHISIRRKWQILSMFFLIILASFSEVLSIGLILPFLSVLTQPEQLFSNSFIKKTAEYFGIHTGLGLLLPLTILFCFSAIFANLMRFFTLLANVRVSNGIGFELSMTAYRCALYQPYSYHLNRNSSAVIGDITKTSGLTEGVILPILNIISGLILLISIIATLFVINPMVAIGTFGGFGLIYFLIMKLSNRSLAISSATIATESSKVGQVLYEGLGGIRDIILNSTQEIFCTIYAKSSLPNRFAQGNSMLLANGPHYGVEAIGMSLIGVVAFLLAVNSDGGVMAAVPTLGALVLGAQRMLPILQRIYGSIANIKVNKDNLIDALELLDRPYPPYISNKVIKKLPFKQSIELIDIKFRYNQDLPFILKGINLEIKKGDRIGIMGKTGGGKSTFLDIFMGLLNPSAGFIKIDTQKVDESNLQEWQACIAHVPQTIFIADASIAENIAFGCPIEKIDFDRVIRAALSAGIASTIELWADGYKTMVGERGVRLSGGQRQRIGIARALYKQAEVLVLDEATSSLDNETEGEVINSIDQLSSDVTILMVAHRLTTLKNCNKIIQIDSGMVVWRGNYEDLIVSRSLIN